MSLLQHRGTNLLSKNSQYLSQVCPFLQYTLCVYIYLFGCYIPPASVHDSLHFFDIFSQHLFNLHVHTVCTVHVVAQLQIYKTGVYLHMKFYFIKVSRCKDHVHNIQYNIILVLTSSSPVCSSSINDFFFSLIDLVFFLFVPAEDKMHRERRKGRIVYPYHRFFHNEMYQ